MWYGTKSRAVGREWSRSKIERGLTEFFIWADDGLCETENGANWSLTRKPAEFTVLATI